MKINLTVGNLIYKKDNLEKFISKAKSNEDIKYLADFIRNECNLHRNIAESKGIESYKDDIKKLNLEINSITFKEIPKCVLKLMNIE